MLVGHQVEHNGLLVDALDLPILLAKEKKEKDQMVVKRLEAAIQRRDEQVVYIRTFGSQLDMYIDTPPQILVQDVRQLKKDLPILNGRVGGLTAAKNRLSR